MLPKKLVMVDLEMTGVNHRRDKVLQVAMIKATLDDSLTYQPVDAINIFIHTDEQPSRPFHKEHLKDAFEGANKSNITLKEAANQIAGFLEGWNDAWFSGDCVHTDWAFLAQNDLITTNDYDEDDNEIKGTCDYRMLDIKPIKALALQLGADKVQDTLVEHDALNDCVNQIQELNHYISWFQERA